MQMFSLRNRRSVTWVMCVHLKAISLVEEAKQKDTLYELIPVTGTRKCGMIYSDTKQISRVWG